MCEATPCLLRRLSPFSSGRIQCPPDKGGTAAKRQGGRSQKHLHYGGPRSGVQRVIDGAMFGAHACEHLGSFTCEGLHWIATHGEKGTQPCELAPEPFELNCGFNISVPQ